MAGQVRREHRKTMVSEPAVVQRPGGVIETRAVKQEDGGQRGVKLLAAGCDKNISAAD